MTLPIGTHRNTSHLTLEPNPETSAKAESSPELSLTSGWSPRSSPQSLPQSSQHSSPAVFVQSYCTGHWDLITHLTS
ncbi:hypothetical protein M404DRAFT_33871 [Pisolithus tinctorius Marx 270]|uniref:Uncharacterized protein n=1 Tax=Pisolithus tinctorius Marx 270 TaxID=870435 RepID=A0A0C3IFQ1_PISTI|nr:hypothetical protein M404DRAFT_33871 [Pisolithus tinctorius Marx 270]